MSSARTFRTFLLSTTTARSSAGFAQRIRPFTSVRPCLTARSTLLRINSSSVRLAIMREKFEFDAVRRIPDIDLRLFRTEHRSPQSFVVGGTRLVWVLSIAADRKDRDRVFHQADEKIAGLRNGHGSALPSG